MQTLIRLEELAMFLFAIFIFSTLPFAWWWFPALLLTPDLGMVGYLVNKRVGAISYNVLHHKAIAICALVIGYFLRNDGWILVGAILLAHSSMDRVFGYGLKFFEGFAFTHLGKIGKGA